MTHLEVLNQSGLAAGLTSEGWERAGKTLVAKEGEEMAPNPSYIQLFLLSGNQKV